MLKRFVTSNSGSVGPIFIVCLPLLLLVVSGSVEYSRVLSHKEQLRSVAELAVGMAQRDGNSVQARSNLAHEFIAANLPDAKFETRRAMEDGDIVFQVRSKLETPMLSVFGKPTVFVKISVPMQRGHFSKDGSFVPVRYSQKQLRAIRRNMDQMIANAPPRYRGHYKRQYDLYYQKLRKNSLNN